MQGTIKIFRSSHCNRRCYGAKSRAALNPPLPSTGNSSVYLCPSSATVNVASSYYLTSRYLCASIVSLRTKGLFIHLQHHGALHWTCVRAPASDRACISEYYTPLPWYTITTQFGNPHPQQLVSWLLAITEQRHRPVVTLMTAWLSSGLTGDPIAKLDWADSTGSGSALVCKATAAAEDGRRDRTGRALPARYLTHRQCRHQP